VVVLECDESCDKGCDEEGRKGCHECKKGWNMTEDDGCVGQWSHLKQQSSRCMQLTISNIDISAEVQIGDAMDQREVQGPKGG